MSQPRLCGTPCTIQKNRSFRHLLYQEAIECTECLAYTISLIHQGFDGDAFQHSALKGLWLKPYPYATHLARVLRKHLPRRYDHAIQILVRSLPPPGTHAQRIGLGESFYSPYIHFVTTYGMDQKYNDGHDPFEISMTFLRQLTRRFSAVYPIRLFLIKWPRRTLIQLKQWTTDSDPKVRLLCSESTRPHLQGTIRVPALIKNPRPVFPILESLKNDTDSWVLYSVARNISDIAKNHPRLAFALCERWLDGATPQRKWLLQHAVRHPAMKGAKAALQLEDLPDVHSAQY